MDRAYLVPLIAPDLRQEENILQIADLLQQLNGVVADVFGRIDARIEQNRTRTRLAAARIEACGRRVDRLTGTNKSTRVCCTAKYPAAPAHHFPSLFPPAAPAQGGLVCPPRLIGAKASLCSDKELQDKLEFYHVKLSCPSPLQALLEGTGERGRGSVPSQLRALGGLLLRGPQETAYSSVGGPRAPAAPAGPDPPAPGLHAAPATVAQRDLHATQHHYLYSPSTGEVPSLDVPQDLPHLAGVAGDLRFHAGTGPAIAPSVLPRPEEPLAVPPTPAASQGPPAPAALQGPRVAAASQGPPPPPPPPPPAPEFEETDSKGQNATTQKAAPPVQRPLAPPAPPPPPPPVLAPPVPPAPAPSVPRQPPALDSRASLMDAIRKAGGSGKASLRSTASKDQAAPTEASGGGGDLMADLHARLSMRRKGISGAQGGAGGTILAAISAIVPPPAEHDTPSNSELSSAEDDWD